MSMVRHKTNRRSGGFTMVETMAVVAVLMILFAISALAVARYRDLLKITELDNAAREIYMAAENRAVLLKGGNQLDPILESAVTLSEGVAPLAEGESSPRCYVDGPTAVSKGLLTAGAIEPTLLKGDLAIVYSPDGGSVTDVFYTDEKSRVGDIGAAFTIAGNRDMRMRREAGMLGYYGGESADAGDWSYTPLGAAKVMVEIHNELQLTVDVTFALPDGANWEDAEKKVQLVYGGQTLILPLDSSVSGPQPSKVTQSGNTRMYTWLLDSLDNGRRFRNLFVTEPGPLGDDFTVNAEIKLSESGRKSSTASGSDTGNSLFAEGSGGETARIENLRHLQNLDAATSKAGGKTGAVQLKDIDCSNGSDYLFRPIVNGELTSFYVAWNEGGTGDARRYELRDLHVTQASAGGKPGAGLFASSNDGAEKAVTFTGVRLVDAQVEAGDMPAGALVGAAGVYNVFQDVCVTNATVSTTGADAGGVVGTAKERCEFENVQVSETTVKAQGNNAAGGVAGMTGENCEFENVQVSETTVTAAGTGAAGGVVGTVVSANTDQYTFETIRVVNTRVEGKAAGGIAGSAVPVSGTGTNDDIVKLTDCRVYWEDEGQLNLRGMLGVSPNYKYQITGTDAGGLVGRIDGMAQIEKSFAATLVKGKQVGGLVGTVLNIFTAKTSYADCYLSGSAAVGGLVGGGKTIHLTNVYTAGFIDGEDSAEAVGGIIGQIGAKENENSTGKNVYTAMSYAGVKEGTDVEPGVPGNNIVNCYYLADSAKGKTSAQPRPYEQMIHPDFFTEMGSAFEPKVHESAGSDRTYPYNLQEKQNLTAYSFPGLVGLPHYGDWTAFFKEPSLVYYEQYNTEISIGDSKSSIGFSGGNARYLVGEVGSLESGTHIVTDGYAVALLEEDVPQSGTFTIQYTYLDPKTGTLASTPVTYTNAATVEGEKLLKATWEGHDYYLAPLPDDLVILGYAEENFYQYLGVEITGSGTSGLNKSSEYFYNPHFAETVEPYTKEGSLVSGSMTDTEAVKAIQDYTAGIFSSGRTLPVSVRTPRHLYDLSVFPEYYNTKHSLAFHQGLDLDYTLYEGYDFGKDLTRWPAQKPIGTSGEYFTGSYDGGCHFIENTPLDLQDSAYAGLFGYSTGTLENIVYIQAPDAQPVLKLHKDTTLGALAGHNAGTIRNCAVAGVDLILNASDSTDYIGGLVGENVGRIENCAAEVACLHVEAYNYCKVYAGGLVGRNTSALGVSGSYAVGRLSTKTEKEDENVSLCGFAGQNQGGVIRGCYAAMDLVADGAGAKAYGFCHSRYSGRQSSVYFLDRGNFTYREQSFLANFDGDKGSRATWAQLTGNAAEGEAELTLTGMTADVAAGYVEAGAEMEEPWFPFYSGVTDAKGQAVHYGLWPTQMELGEMGLYYWEEVDRGGQTSYHFTTLAVDTDQFRIVKDSTLSKLHDEGGEVTRYGYGFYSTYYNSEDSRAFTVRPASAEENSRPLLCWDSVKSLDFAGSLNTLEQNKESADSAFALDKKVDDALAELNEGYEFHSFHTYDPDAAEPSGLYPQAGQQNCVLTLELLNEVENPLTSVEFTLSPFFADAMSVKPPKVGNDSWELISKVGEVDFNTDNTDTPQTPGSVGNPYEVRSVSQLKLMNWYNNPVDESDKGNRTTTNIMTKDNVHTAPTGTLDTNKGFFDYDVETDENGKPVLVPHGWNTVDGLGQAYYTYVLIKKEGRWTVDTDLVQDDPTHYIVCELVEENGTYRIENKLVPRGEQPPSSDSGSHFPYLNSQYQRTAYHWEQTYDLMGQGKYFTPIAEYYEYYVPNYQPDKKGEMQDIGRDYGALAGWFGGVYDGGGYMIEDLNIQGQLSSCAGMFGVVYDGSLRNIVLYSSSGESEVTTQSNPNSDTRSQWIAMGALAGVAGTGDKTRNAIENCSVSGYTIQANIGTYEAPKAWGGATIGGLVGASHMNLSRCSAVVNVKLTGAQVYDNMRIGGLAGICQGSVTQCYAGGEITFGKQEDIKITKGIYVGGLVGGSYMHPLEVSGMGKYIGTKSKGFENETNNELTDCYSYVKLPRLTQHERLFGLYAVGGTGEINPKEAAALDADGNPTDAANHGVCTMTSCYYLESEVLANNKDLEVGFPVSISRDGVAIYLNFFRNTGWGIKTDVNDLTINPKPKLYPIAIPVTYEELAGDVAIDAPVRGSNGKIQHNYVQIYDPDGSGMTRWIDYPDVEKQKKNIFDLLNEPDANGNPVRGTFAPVTTMVGSLSVPGRYSYPPATSPELAGLDYPFPTIMTKAGNHVHYGSWPLSGFYRVDAKGNMLGGEPIRIDLFAEKPYMEYLVLTEETVKGGRWKLTYANEEDAKKIAEFGIERVDSIAAAGGKQGAALTLKGLSEGTFPLTITYTDTTGAEYTLTISVHVSAEVKLQPATVYMFPNDSVTLKLQPVNSEGTLLAKDALKLGSLRVISAVETPDGAPAPLEATIAGLGPAKEPGVTLVTHGASDLSTVSAQFTYTVAADAENKDYHCEDVIQVPVIKPWTTDWARNETTVEKRTKTGTDEVYYVAYDAGNADDVKPGTEGGTTGGAGGEPVTRAVPAANAVIEGAADTAVEEPDPAAGNEPYAAPAADAVIDAAGATVDPAPDDAAPAAAPAPVAVPAANTGGTGGTTEGGSTGDRPEIYTRSQDTCTITFPNTYTVYKVNGDTDALSFRINAVKIANKAVLGENPPMLVYETVEDEDGVKNTVITLTWPAVYTNAEDAEGREITEEDGKQYVPAGEPKPPVTLEIGVTVDSEDTDSNGNPLIPEPQEHTLTLTAEQPDPIRLENGRKEEVKPDTTGLSFFEPNSPNGQDAAQGSGAELMKQPVTISEAALPPENKAKDEQEVLNDL